MTIETIMMKRSVVVIQMQDMNDQDQDHKIMKCQACLMMILSDRITNQDKGMIEQDQIMAIGAEAIEIGSVMRNIIVTITVVICSMFINKVDISSIILISILIDMIRDILKKWLITDRFPCMILGMFMMRRVKRGRGVITIQLGAAPPLKTFCLQQLTILQGDRDRGAVLAGLDPLHWLPTRDTIWIHMTSLTAILIRCRIRNPHDVV